MLRTDTFNWGGEGSPIGAYGLPSIARLWADSPDIHFNQDHVKATFGHYTTDQGERLVEEGHRAKEGHRLDEHHKPSQALSLDVGDSKCQRLLDEVQHLHHKQHIWREAS